MYIPTSVSAVTAHQLASNGLLNGSDTMKPTCYIYLIDPVALVNKSLWVPSFRVKDTYTFVSMFKPAFQRCM